MSCTFTCDACNKTVKPEYRDGKWQHPEGWWTRGATTEGAGYTACSEACAKQIDAREHAWPRARAAAA